LENGFVAIDSVSILRLDISLRAIDTSQLELEHVDKNDLYKIKLNVKFFWILKPCVRNVTNCSKVSAEELMNTSHLNNVNNSAN